MKKNKRTNIRRIKILELIVEVLLISRLKSVGRSFKKGFGKINAEKF